jgi:type II secretory pathway pseudopilin PulG
MLTTVLAIVALVIIISLATYAAILWARLRRHRTELDSQQAAQTLQQQQNAASAKDNITILLRVVEQGQVSLTEAAIRVGAYRMALAPQLRDLEAFSAFDLLANETSHIPILDRWQALSNIEQAEFEQQRTVIEERHSAAITDATLQLLTVMQAKS